jgi:hypothetical protein
LTDAGEFTSLAANNISSIDIGYTSVSESNAGHTVSSRSTVSLTDGGTAEIVDVWFENNPLYRWDLYADDPYRDDVVVLPNIRGLGNVGDLWHEIENDASLLADVESLVNQDFSNFSFASFSDQVESILVK